MGVRATGFSVNGTNSAASRGNGRCFRERRAVLVPVHCTFTELLFGIKTGARFVARARFHAAVNAGDLEAPARQTAHQ